MVRAFARRAKNLKDSKNAATGLLCYSRLKLSKGRDTYNVNEAFPIEVFFGLRKDVTALALAQYFCQLAVGLVPEGVESSEYLRLVLNALHFLCQGTRPSFLLKAIVELRMVSEAAICPTWPTAPTAAPTRRSACTLKSTGGAVLQVLHIHTGDPCAPLSPAALTAMRHIVLSDFEKIFSFSVSPGALGELSAAAEAYTVEILQKRPKTLDFYHSML